MPGLLEKKCILNPRKFREKEPRENRAVERWERELWRFWRIIWLGFTLHRNRWRNRDQREKIRGNEWSDDILEISNFVVENLQRYFLDFFICWLTALSLTLSNDWWWNLDQRAKKCYNMRSVRCFWIEFPVIRSESSEIVVKKTSISKKKSVV